MVEEYNNIISDIDYISKDCIEKIKTYLLENYINSYHDCSLTTGLSGLLCLFSNNENKDNITSLSQYILDNANYNDFSLFSGLSGIGLSFLLVNDKYDVSEVINSILHIILNNDNLLLKPDLNNLKCIDYDLAYGYTGIITFILSYKENMKNIDTDLEYKSNQLIKKYLNYIEEIIENPVNNHYPFWISNNNQMIDLDKTLFQDGSYNMGTAHGILGVIQVVSRIYNNHIYLEKSKKIIIKLVNIMIHFLTFKNGEIIIPPRATDKLEILDNDNFLYQDGWCYGQLSIGLTLINIGKLLKITHYIDLGTQISNQSLKKIKTIDQYLPSVILCHGKSGILMLLFYAINNQLLEHQILEEQLLLITKKIIAQYNKDYILGFKDKEYDNNNFVYFDKFNLLEGTIGVILILQLVKNYLLDTFNNNNSIVLKTFLNY